MKTKSIKIKVVALSLTLCTMFGGMTPNMMQAKGINGPRITGPKITEPINGPVINGPKTNTQTEDSRPLERYLKSIVPKDKNTLLVDKGTGAQYDLTPKTTENSDNSFTIIKREKESAQDQTSDIATVNGTTSVIYPGAVVHADSKLVDGQPNLVTGLDYKPVEVGVDVNGNTQDPILVENPTKHRVDAAVNKQVEKWLETGKTAAAQATYRSAMVYDEKQIETQLGIKNAAKTYGVDVKANVNGQKKEMLVVFNQVYYTATVEPRTASKIFADNVTPKDLEENGIDADNPGAAQVTSIDYGRQIVVKLETNKLTTDVEAAWNASVGVNKIENDNKYKGVMENTKFSVYAYGGSTDAAGKLITTTKDLDKVNEIIAQDINFKKGSAVRPMSYCTHFIDDGSKAQVSKTTDYIKTTVVKRDQIKVRTDAANAYVTKSQKFYARPIIGVDDNGNLKLGAWKKIMDEGGGDKTFYISGKYAEFGFGFDIKWGTDWPYSNVFWTVNKGAASDIFIEWGGTCRNAWITIDVDGNQVVKSTNCSRHNEYNFGV